ncbi:MAG: transcription elongation factor GreA [Patescibacteria group bacterium]
MPHYITEEGLLALRNELQDIIDNQLPAVVKSIEAALKDGDIKENSPLSAAKEKRDELLMRQGQIETILADYQIIKDVTDTSKVRIGSTVTVLFTVNNREVTYRIVGSSEANPENGSISDESPLGAALLGKKVDDLVEYKSPAGMLSVKLIKIE